MGIDPAIAGAWAATFVSTLWAALKTAEVTRTKKEVKETADTEKSEKQKAWERYDANDKAWEDRFNRLHKEFEDQRKYWHDKAQGDQALLTKCQMECSELRGRTDLTPIVEYLKHRTDVDDAILQAITRMHERLDNFLSAQQANLPKLT